MSFRIIFGFFIICSGQAYSSELTVYRWVDKNNVVHFSQHQPLGDEYTQFLASNQSRILTRTDLNKGDGLLSDTADTLSKSEQSITSTIDVSEQCQEAKKNVSMLITFDKVQYTDDNGNKKVLTKQEKHQQLVINQKRTEVYCAPSIDKQ